MQREGSPGKAYLGKGAFSEAIAEFKHEKVPWEESVWLLGMTYALMGQKDEARKILNGLQVGARRAPKIGAWSTMTRSPNSLVRSLPRKLRKIRFLCVNLSVSR
jgi:hypothetical protein